MKKIIIFINLILLSLLISGCGCSKKEEEKMMNLKCSSDINEYGEKNIVTAEFKNNFLVSEKIETIVEFTDEILAQRYYDMYKDNERYKVSLDGMTVTYYLEIENDSTEDIFEYNNFRNNLIDNGYNCN